MKRQIVLFLLLCPASWALGEPRPSVQQFNAWEFGLFIHWGIYSIASVESYYRDTTKPISTNFHGEPWRPEWPMFLDYVELQITELLTRYGPAAIVWFDAIAPLAEFDGRRYVDLIHKLQPDALINNRLGVGGDYDTPEQHLPKGVPTAKVAGNNLNVINNSVGGADGACGLCPAARQWGATQIS